ncbi:autotransporter outer membrane beta-barrel domain-containing protein [Pseudomonas koreensis]|nr:autotransporter outer membrane beta-barrel domain-containing protein [Pseudomonas koreensis]
MNKNHVSLQKNAAAGLFKMLVVLPAFFSTGGHSFAAVIVDNGNTLNIDASTPQSDYLVRNASVLNIAGASTQSLSVTSGSTLNINGATVNADSGLVGIRITGSTGDLTRAIVTSDFMGLAVNRSIGSTLSSTVTATDSQFKGGEIGAQVTGLSTLTLINSQVTGTGADSTGLNILGGDVRASANTVISGDKTGVTMGRDPSGLGNNSLRLDNASVEGRTGDAILVDKGINATLEVLNQSSLTGGNGNVLTVQGASTAGMSVSDSTLQGNVNVTGNSTANLTFDQGNMKGDVLVENGSTANVTLQNNSQLTGRLDKVNGVTVNSGSSWTLTGADTVGTLAMNGGTVRFGAQDVPDTFYQLNVGTLAGSPDGSSTFEMKGNFATGQHDFLNVTGVASGQFGLLVAASGLDALSPQRLTLVHTAAGDAQFALRGGHVDLGTWSYKLDRREVGEGGTEWFLDPTTKTISPGAKSVLALFNAPVTLLYAEAATLRSRMGELRFNGGDTGLWMRTYGNKYNISAASGVGYQQTQQGLSLGADTHLGDSLWVAGIMGGYSHTNLDVAQGTSGTVDSYYLGPYVTWMNKQSGYYFDALLKFNRFQSDTKVGMSDGTRAKGSYDSSGVSASAEFGRQIKLEDGYFIEPYGKLSTAVIQGRNFDLDNGMEADGDRSRSVLGEAGTTVGRNFNMGNGMVAQPYVRVAVQHEFINNNRVTVNADNQFNNDLSGTRGVLGAGVAVALTKDLQVYAGYDYSHGKYIEKPYELTVGARWTW